MTSIVVKDSSGLFPSDRRSTNHLSLVDLLTLTTGANGQAIVDALSKNQFNPLDRLARLSHQELCDLPGIGPAKASLLLAAIELGRRIYQPLPKTGVIVDDPAVAANALSHELSFQEKEKFAVVLLDIKHRLLGIQVISLGTATETLAHPREIFNAVICHKAVRCIVAHNHPSGDLDPSKEDMALTRQLLKAAQILSIPVIDHLILGAGNFRSLRQTTTLWQEHPQNE